MPAGASLGGRDARAIRAILFDLDGTLLDTVEDITRALNLALAEQRLGPLAVDTVRGLIGRGAPTLMRRAGQALGEPSLDAVGLLDRFCVHYGLIYRDAAASARAYPGVRSALERLRALGYRLGVVTNKRHGYAEGLLREQGLAPCLDAIVGGDSASARKPSPEPLWLACRLLGQTREATLMVGDSATDVLAARAAGLPVVCVRYGYNEGGDPDTLAADALLDTLAQLPALLGHSEG